MKSLLILILCPFLQLYSQVPKVPSLLGGNQKSQFEILSKQTILKELLNQNLLVDSEEIVYTLNSIKCLKIDSLNSFGYDSSYRVCFYKVNIGNFFECGSANKSSKIEQGSGNVQSYFSSHHLIFAISYAHTGAMIYRIKDFLTIDQKDFLSEMKLIYDASTYSKIKSFVKKVNKSDLN